jgi:hypothetical protein
VFFILGERVSEARDRIDQEQKQEERRVSLQSGWVSLPINPTPRSWILQPSCFAQDKSYQIHHNLAFF